MKQLEDNGSWYEIVCVRRPAEVMAWLVARKFDLYLIDTSMPGESALGMCHSVRKVNKDGAVICISPNGEEREILLGAGADLFLKMPDAIGQLRQTIDDLLDGPRSHSTH